MATTSYTTDIIGALQWRYATKRMTGAKVPQEKIDRILEVTRLAPSSFGVQPYTILVIENREMRDRIQPLANGQPQVAEASHLLVFAAWDSLDEKRVGEHVDHAAIVRAM